MSESERGSIEAADAAAALRVVQQAREAARGRPAPAWTAPAAGGLFAVAQACVGVSGLSFDGSWVFLVLAAGFAAAFLAVLVRGARSGGVLAWPAGSMAARSRTQGALVLAYALGWLAAVPFGAPGGWIASGVTEGLALWAVAGRAAR